jgi:putative NADH-flavin reductase
VRHNHLSFRSETSFIRYGNNFDSLLTVISIGSLYLDVTKMLLDKDQFEEYYLLGWGTRLVG